MTTTQSQFGCTHNRGFHMTFNNGITISVQFGRGNYCERRDGSYDAYNKSDANTPIVVSKNAEIAIWHKDSDTWFTFDSRDWNDQVKGWVSVQEVAEWISYIKHARDLNHLREMAILAGLYIEDEGPEVDSAENTEEDK